MSLFLCDFILFYYLINKKSSKHNLSSKDSHPIQDFICIYLTSSNTLVYPNKFSSNLRWFINSRIIQHIQDDCFLYNMIWKILK